MTNVETEIQGNILLLKIDLSQEIGDTSTGKSIAIASSGGGVPVPGREEVKLNLTVYRPKKKQGK